MKHNMNQSIFENFVFIYKGSINIPGYKCLLIGRVQYLYTIEPAVENIAYHRIQLISVTLLSLLTTVVSSIYLSVS